jgi:hypothetical protein
LWLGHGLAAAAIGQQDNAIGEGRIELGRENTA